MIPHPPIIPSPIILSPAAVPPAPALPDRLGISIGDGISTLVSGSVDQFMKAIWEGCIWFLGQVFGFLDWLSTFSVSQTDGPIGQLWPTLVALSGVIALGLFFWQITAATVRGGRGMWHAATGTVSYGIALALTVTVVASLLAAADGMTQLILAQGIQATTFTGAYQHIPFSQIAYDKVKPVVLGLIGLCGILPAAFGYALEMVFRQAAILVLVASVPITAAGLLARSTARWFWMTARWVLSAIILKPVIALVLVIGLGALSGAQGFMGLLAGVAVLWVALVSPVALFKLLAFVDPATDTGAAFRDAASNLTSRLGTPAFAGDGGGDYGSGYASFGSSKTDTGGVGDLEQANTDRFDGASSTNSSLNSGGSTSGGSNSGGGSDDIGVPPPEPTGHISGQSSPTRESQPGAAPPDQSMPHAGSETTATQQPDSGSDPPDHPDSGGDGGGGGGRPIEPHPTPPHGGGSGGAPAPQAAQAAETAAETAAVIL